MNRENMFTGMNILRGEGGPMKWYNYHVKAYKGGMEGEPIFSFKATGISISEGMILALGDSEGHEPEVPVLVLGANQYIERGRSVHSSQIPGAEGPQLSTRYCSECGAKQPWRKDRP